MALYAQLDCAFVRDPKMVTAGPMARLMYVQTLLYCRENLTDGVVDKVLLPIVAMDISSPKKHMDRLVQVGALEACDVGWRIPDRVWRKWNPTAAQIEEQRETKRLAGVTGNHERWHVRTGTTDPKCDLCRSQSDRTVRHDAKRVGSPKPEPEGKPEEEAERTSLNPQQSNARKRLAPNERKTILEDVAERIADARGLRNQGRNPSAYFASCVKGIVEEVHDQVHDLLTEHPEWDASQVADRIAHPPRPSAFPEHWTSTRSGTIREPDYLS